MFPTNVSTIYVKYDVCVTVLPTAVSRQSAVCRRGSRCQLLPASKLNDQSAELSQPAEFIVERCSLWGAMMTVTLTIVLPANLNNRRPDDSRSVVRCWMLILCALFLDWFPLLCKLDGHAQVSSNSRPDYIVWMAPNCVRNNTAMSFSMSLMTFIYFTHLFWLF